MGNVQYLQYQFVFWAFASLWSEQPFLQVFYTLCQRVYNMSNGLYCWAKPVNICPFSTPTGLSHCPLSSFTPNYIVLPFLINCFLRILSLYLRFLYILYLFSPFSHFLSSFSLSLRGQEQYAQLSWQQRWEDKMEESWPSLQGKNLECKNNRWCL